MSLVLNTLALGFKRLKRSTTAGSNLCVLKHVRILSIREYVGLPDPKDKGPKFIRNVV